jgi:salicylate hydroxylase
MSADTTKKHVIAGGGIAGLSSAIAMARNDIEVCVLERAKIFSEVGAGLQLGPNAMHILREWGVADFLESRAVKPKGIRIHDGISGKLLNTVPLGNRSEQRYGAPYKVMHRADLQAALLQIARSMPSIEIINDFAVNDFTADTNAVSVVSEDGKSIEGRALIGADGAWSKIRQKLHNAEPVFTGKCAWRAIIPASNQQECFRQPYTNLWMGPGAHLVHYPVSGGDNINVVAVFDDPDYVEGWDSSGKHEKLMAQFSRWHATPRGFLEQIMGWRKWSLHTLASPLATWGKGLVTLIGDAAHPPVPFLAQGGAMAIEDAFILAREITDNDDTASALGSYATKRIKRANTLISRSHKMGRTYQMSGLARLARNTILRARTPDSLLVDFDWLYTPIE